MLIREELRQINEFSPGKFAFQASQDKKLSNEEISRALDRELANKHASGRKFHSAFIRSVNENEERARISAGVYDISANDLAEMIRDLSKRIGRAKIQVAVNKDSNFLEKYKLNSAELNDIENTVLMSVLLFTDGSVTALRDPDAFNPAKAEKIYGSEIKPQKVDYELANYVMTKIATAAMKPVNIYRGISVEKNVADNLRPGIEFNNWDISSWTTSNAVALRFAYHTTISTRKKEMVPLMLNILPSSYGCNISRISGYPSEEEVVMGKRILIKKVEKKTTDYGSHFSADCEVISSSGDIDY